jgi:replicative DNA helicase
VQELTDITTSLKALAKELEIPIVALAQVSREVDKRDNKRPLLGDLRESGSLEQDADMVLLLYREEYYLKDAKPREGTEAFLEWERRMAQVKGVAEVNIAKQRHGPPCIVTMGFNAELTRFLNEPDPRDETMEPIREKKKEPLRLPADSPRILRELQAMEIHKSIPNKDLDVEGVPRWVKKVVDYMDWKERCVEQFCDPDQTDAAKAKFMRDAMVPLMDNGFIGRAGNKVRSYVWLTDLGRK